MILLNYTMQPSKVQHLKQIHHYNAQADDKYNAYTKCNDLLDEFLIQPFSDTIHIGWQDIIIVAIIAVIHWRRILWNRFQPIFLLFALRRFGLFLEFLFLRRFFWNGLRPHLLRQRLCYACFMGRKLLATVSAEDYIFTGELASTIRTIFHLDTLLVKMGMKKDPPEGRSKYSRYKYNIPVLPNHCHSSAKTVPAFCQMYAIILPLKALR